MKQLLQSSQQNEQMTHNKNRNNDKTMKYKSLYANISSEIKIDKGRTTITQIDDRYLPLTEIWSFIMAQEATFERSTSRWRGLVPVSLQWHGHFVPRLKFNSPPPGLTTITLPSPREGQYRQMPALCLHSPPSRALHWYVHNTNYMTTIWL